MGRRREQIASTILRAVQAEFAKGFADPRLDGLLITATSIRLSEDLRNATVLVSVHPKDRTDLAMHALRAAAKHVRHEIADVIDLKRTPEILFKPDPGAARHAAVSEALAAIRAEREQVGDDTARDPSNDDTPDHPLPAHDKESE